jgi:threonine dehydratase
MLSRAACVCQGTVALELLEQVREEHGVSLDAVIVPIGGGGLISGIATVVRTLQPETLVLAAEPANAADAFRSKETGALCKHLSPPKTIADGLMTVLGVHTFPVVMSSVDEVITVTEAEIAAGVKVVYERMKLAIEPSAGVGVAVALGARVKALPPEVKNIGVILCGGNVDLGRLSEIFRMAENGGP